MSNKAKIYIYKAGDPEGKLIKYSYRGSNLSEFQNDKLVISVGSAAHGIGVRTSEYMNFAFSSVPGMKVLIMDDELIQVVSVLFGMSEIIQKEVYLVQKIEDTSREILPHLNAVCIFSR